MDKNSQKHIPMCDLTTIIMIEAVVMNYITALGMPLGFGCSVCGEDLDVE